MTDREHLIWIHARLENYGDSELLDWMHRLRSIICKIPESQCSPVGNTNSLQELRKQLEVGNCSCRFWTSSGCDDRRITEEEGAPKKKSFDGCPDMRPGRRACNDFEPIQTKRSE